MHTLTLFCRTWLLLILFPPLCVFGIHFVMVVVSPCRVQRIQLTILLQLALNTSPRYCLALALSLPPWFLSSSVPFASLSLSILLTLWSLKPHSTFYRSRLSGYLIFSRKIKLVSRLSLCIHPTFLKHPVHFACLAMFSNAGLLAFLLWWWIWLPLFGLLFYLLILNVLCHDLDHCCCFLDGWFVMFNVFMLPNVKSYFCLRDNNQKRCFSE